jgi:serine/threonine protein kinase
MSFYKTVGGYVTASDEIYPPIIHDYRLSSGSNYNMGQQNLQPFGNGYFSESCDIHNDFEIDFRKQKGSGYFSKVYDVCKNLTDCKYVAKVSLINLSGQKQAYENEVNTYKILNQQNFGIKIAPTMYDNWTCEKRSDLLSELNKYGNIVLEKLGKNLSQINKIPCDTKVNLVYQLLTKIRALANNGIYHNDIKLENVMITDDFKNLYITDYGTVGFFNAGNKQELDFYSGNMFLQAEPVVLHILSKN